MVTFPPGRISTVRFQVAAPFLTTIECAPEGIWSVVGVLPMKAPSNSMSAPSTSDLIVTMLGAEATAGAPEFRWQPAVRRPERPPVRKAAKWLCPQAASPQPFAEERSAGL